jgi:hypothetical protein
MAKFTTRVRWARRLRPPLNYWGRKGVGVKLIFNFTPTPINTHAEITSRNDCAKYTRRAIEAGGVILARHNSAQDYGPSLQAAGFSPLVSDNGVYLLGDVVVINAFAGKPHGHMAMFNGTNWVSDFVQRDLYPGPDYRTHRPIYTIYRRP